jgi:pimeloyl-ACP methyl ester carboxylesterase
MKAYGIISSSVALLLAVLPSLTQYVPVAAFSVPQALSSTSVFRLSIHSSSSRWTTQQLGASSSSISGGSTSSSTSTTADTAVTIERPTWNFRGHKIYSEVTKSKKITDNKASSSSQKPVIVLIHGFACSTTYWRELVQVLTVQGGYTVYALDLIGQGQSAKAGRAQGIHYSINLWAELVDQYVQDNIKRDATTTNEKVVLIGNSLGSLVALAAATGDFGSVNNNFLQSRVAGVGMFNCGVGLNSRGIANEVQWTPLQRFFINRFYDVLVLLIFNNQLLLEYVLGTVVTRDLLRDALQTLYKSRPDRVDDALVDSFYLPAKQDGAADALSQIYVNDPGKTPVQLHEQYKEFLDPLPIHLVWGENDVVTPLPGGIGTYYMERAKDPSNKITFQSIPNCGHIPFDDNDIPSNQSMLQWLQTL